MKIWKSVSGPSRVARAVEWLRGQDPARPLLVLGATLDAAQDLLRQALVATGHGDRDGPAQTRAAFGWRARTLPRLAADVTNLALALEQRSPIGRLACEAVLARVVHAASAGGSENGSGSNAAAPLGRFAPVAHTPGFVRALTGTFSELRLAGLGPADAARESEAVGALLGRYERELERAGLCDWPAVLRAAIDAVGSGDTGGSSVGLAELRGPVLLADVAVETDLEAALVAQIAARAPDALAIVPAGDERTLARLASIAGDALPGDTRDTSPRTALAELRAHLFVERDDPGDRRAEHDDGTVAIFSAPGESRECVEIARRVVRLAHDGTPLDKIAVLLRAPEDYGPPLEEALARAGVPAHFERGVVRPDPAGRAFVALLRCAQEGLSATRFAEYLSLAQVPDADAHGAPPAARPSGERWVAPDQDLVPEAIAAALAATGPERDDGGGGEREGERDAASDPDADPVTAGTLRAPRRWERLLVDAAVIGGLDRWRRRLDGLESELEVALRALDDADHDEAYAQRIERALDDLAALRGYALPLLEELEQLPPSDTGASWEQWLDALGALATRALRAPERVLSVLAELAPMGAIGPVDLREVLRVLERQLLELRVPPAGSRYGKLFVGPIDAARGRAFDVVLVPGLAERMFPKKIQEDPILLDRFRARLGKSLTTNDDRVARERLALRLAVGAARERVVLSYPRVDIEQARPRVPSFYALEALRAAEGRLPLFDDLARRAEATGAARVGWPAPRDRAHAIDDAEYDLAVLATLIDLDPDATLGAARYLLDANQNLARALRFRARRWLRAWTVADGLWEPSEAGRAALAPHRLDARSFSPTALQHYATCPYRFFLYAVHRLAPREQPIAIEELDPLQRGSLVHDVQFELLTELRDEDLLPVTPQNLDACRARLDAALDRVAARYRDDLAPAIERVWQDGVASVRADLREWLRRAAEDTTGFAPWRFELSFGLKEPRARDPHSVEEPVALDCGLRLRGSIDLIERGPGDTVRVTDHKTGKVRVGKDAVIDGGRSLQPVLYALAAEQIFPDHEVHSGRLYYCTMNGGYAERVVPADGTARKAAQVVADTVGKALEDGAFPAVPVERACEWCDYNVVCGPHEELRTRRKPRAPIRDLDELRQQR